MKWDESRGTEEAGSYEMRRIEARREMRRERNR